MAWKQYRTRRQAFWKARSVVAVPGTPSCRRDAGGSWQNSSRVASVRNSGRSSSARHNSAASTARLSAQDNAVGQFLVPGLPNDD